MTELKNINNAVMSLNENYLLHTIICGKKNLDNNQIYQRL